MRLSLRLVFFGIVASGLPFAVTIGWHAGQSPPERPPAVPDDAGGSARLGSSPAPTGSPSGPADERGRGSARPAAGGTPAPRRSPRPVSGAGPSGTAPKPVSTPVSVPPVVVPTATTVPPSDPPAPTPSGEVERTPGVLRDRG